MTTLDEIMYYMTFNIMPTHIFIMANILNFHFFCIFCFFGEFWEILKLFVFSVLKLQTQS